MRSTAWPWVRPSWSRQVCTAPSTRSPACRSHPTSTCKAAPQQAGVSVNLSAALPEVNAQARVEGLRNAVALFRLAAAGALFAARRISQEPVGSPSPVADKPADTASDPAP
jgi:hypothetical protein